MNLKESIGNHTILIFIISLLILLSAALFSLSIGTAEITILDTARILVQGKNAADVSQAHTYIIHNVRVPRIITALLVGMSLSISGVIFQALFRNPMAEPFILGVSSGAAFGVSLGSFLGAFILIPGIWGVPLFAFGGAVTASTFIYFLSGGMRSSTLTLLLSGVAMNFFLSSLMSLFMFFNREQLESIVYWSMGSFSSASWEKLAVAGPLLLAGILVLPKYRKELDLLLLGEETAKAMGLSVRGIRIGLLIVSTLLTALAV
ncbi:MAG: iron ABC transporter permease, partial [Spirochaetales bacterium]|nr:iron ABC transporter permease [Spirochaetales bacterium]